MFDGLPRPLLFAHRGASMHAPENTLEAFELAVRLGADVLELDVHVTRDGEVVVIHDPTVERTTNGRGAVRDLTYAELRELDAGWGFRDGAGEHFFRNRDVYVPRLADVFTAFPRVGFNIELKQREPSIVQPVLRLLARLRPEHVLLTAGDDAIMRELEAARPSCALGLSAGHIKRVLRGAYGGGVPRELAGRALQIPTRHWLLPIATRRVIGAAHDAGLEVHVWTINSPRAAARWLRLGVDGIMSDDPGALAGIVRDQRAARSAASG